MKVKKDRIFVIVLAIVAGNLGRELILLANGITSGEWTNPRLWLFLITNIIAFIGVLWLMRASKRSRRIDKEKEKETDYE